MMANGPLEIYAIVIGAKTYDNMFNIFVSFGIAFIPLLYVFFKGLEVYLHSRSAEEATGVASKRILFGVLGLYVIGMMLFVAPTHKLDVKSIGYLPRCAPTGTPLSTFGDTGTTYDKAFGDIAYDNIRLPLGLSLALTLTSGFTNALITGIPCKTDVEAIKRTIDTTRLSEALKQQVMRFDSECYAPAQAKFEQQAPDKSTYSSIMKAYGGQSDLGWLGSHTLSTLYYSKQYPIAPVPGFSFGEFPYHYADNNKKAGVAEPKWGFPDCKTWWSDPSLGLEQQLVATVEAHQVKNPHAGIRDLKSELTTWMHKVEEVTGLRTQVSADDEIAHGLLYDRASNAGFGSNYAGWLQDDISGGSSTYAENMHGQVSNGGLVGFVAGAVADVGQAKDAVEGTVARAEIAQEVPILQAVLIAIVLSLGPLILLIGQNRLSVIVPYYFILASLVFVVFIEKLLHYLELSLHSSLGGVYSIGNFSIMYNVFTKLYLYAPMIFLMLMSICGVGIGSAMAQSFSNPASGNKGGFVGSFLGRTIFSLMA